MKKINCDNKSSNCIRTLFNKFDTHGEIYIKINYIESGKSMVNRQGNLIEVPCLFVNGVTKSTYGEFSGTRYIYQEEKIYDEIMKWYKNQNRFNKIKSLGL